MTDHQEITPAILLDHIQGMKQDLLTQMSTMNSSLERKLDEINRNVIKLDRRVGVLEVGVENIDQRLDRMETSLLDQKHEERIVLLEHAVGLAHGS